jgi:hypothetical protein
MRLLMGDSVLINILLYFPPCDLPLFGVAKPLIDSVDTKPLLIANQVFQKATSCYNLTL